LILILILLVGQPGRRARPGVALEERAGGDA
jgi:hypothetical protein